MENTNNIIVVEDQVILVVDLDVVPSESRNEHSTHYNNMEQLPVSLLHTAGNEVTVLSVLARTNSNHLKIIRNMFIANLTLIASRHRIFGKKNTTHGLHMIQRMYRLL